MTLARLSQIVPVASVDEAAAALRARGLRVSVARRVVLEALFAAQTPVTAERIADGLDGQLPRSDLASVYRNLEVFEELGLVRHVHLGHGPGLYALAGQSEREYLVCERCGRVAAVAPAALARARDEVRAATGFEARFAHFPIVGLCPECSGEPS